MVELINALSQLTWPAAVAFAALCIAVAWVCAAMLRAIS